MIVEQDTASAIDISAMSADELQLLFLLSGSTSGVAPRLCAWIEDVITAERRRRQQTPAVEPWPVEIDAGEWTAREVIDGIAVVLAQLHLVRTFPTAFSLLVVTGNRLACGLRERVEDL